VINVSDQGTDRVLSFVLAVSIHDLASLERANSRFSES
jgi:hypothetical protein